VTQNDPGTQKDRGTQNDRGTQSEPGAGARVVRDVALYTIARLALVAALTAAIFFGAGLIGIREFPLVVALLFAIIIALPLGIWLLAPLRRRATAGIAEVDERRRRDRRDLQARLRGDEPAD